MKKLIFCFHFMRKNLFPILLTLLLLTVTFFTMITLFGKVSYKTYATDRIRASGLEDALYVMPVLSRGGDDPSAIRAYREEVSQMDGVAAVLSFRNNTCSYEGESVNVFYYSDEMIAHFPPVIRSGRWLDVSAESLEAVIGGSVWPGVKTGDVVTLSNGLSCRVVGILSDLAVYPAFTRYTNSGCPAEFLFKAIDNIVFLNERAVEEVRIPPYAHLAEPTNFFVRFSETASASERAAVRRYLGNIGIVRTYDDILNDSDTLFREWIREQFPLPLFLLVIATINTIAICAVMLQRSLPDISKYYLLGCTRRYAAVRLTVGMGVLFSLPAAVNILLALFYPHFLRYEINYHTYDYLIDIRCLIPPVVHMAFLMGIIGLLTWFSFRKYSPFDFYRRNLS